MLKRNFFNHIVSILYKRGLICKKIYTFFDILDWHVYVHGREFCDTDRHFIYYIEML